MSDDRWQATIEVPVPPETAFDGFVRRFGEWWPQDYTFAGADLDRIGIEPRVGGPCFELAQDGQTIEWGSVVDIEPPERIAFTWGITPDRRVEPDPAQCSVVTVTFAAAGEEASRITLDHHDFQRHGGDWANYRDMLGSPQGWPLILDRFREHCAAG
jgi:uncharacterized protein YndB with AHSA1/START domain